MKYLAYRYTASKILHTAANMAGAEVADVLGPSREQYLVDVRQAVAYTLRTVRGWSYKRCAGVIGRKDHTTYYHSHRAIDDEIASGIPSLRAHIAKALAPIASSRYEVSVEQEKVIEVQP